MITAIEGILEYRNVDSITIKVGAISLSVVIPSSTLNQLTTIGAKIKLHTHLHFREDNISLYGFLTKGELAIFQKLITVSGVGPRLACALLSTFNPDKIVSAIITGNADFLSQATGVGKKLAARIVLELKGKLEKEWQGDFMPIMIQENSDVITALTGLGYSVKEATHAVAELPDISDLSIEEKIRLALQELALK